MKRHFLHLCIILSVFFVISPGSVSNVAGDNDKGQKETRTDKIIKSFKEMISPGSVSNVAGDNNKVQLVIQTDKVKNLPKELYGFNTNMIHGLWEYTDPDIIDITSSLKPNVLRFPGGTVANFYHWKKAGFDKRELDASPIKWLSSQHENLQKSRKGILSFDNFMMLCNKFNIKPILVVNLYTGTPEESAEWVRYVKGKGYQVFGWELGNELNFPMYKDKFKNPADYVSTAKKHAAAMRAVDPNIRIAVVAHAGAYYLLDSRREKKANKWDEGLGNERFFDAYVAHLYVDEEYIKGKSKKGIESLKNDIFEASDAILEKSTTGFKRIFRGKEMWVTEWNIQFKEDNTGIADTLLHALYCGDFFINMAKTDVITATDYHILSGPWNGYPLISQAGKDSKSVVKRACYYSFDVLNDAMSISHRKFLLNVENAPLLKKSNQYTGSPVLGISAVSIGTDKKVFVLVSNRTSGDVSPNIVLDGKHYVGNVKYTYLSAKSLDSTGKDNQIEIRTKTDKANKLVLSSNSFGLLELLEYQPH